MTPKPAAPEGFRFRRELSIDTVIAVVVLIVSVTIAYSKLSERISMMEGKLEIVLTAIKVSAK